jgi:ABC-2 type transport system permease protein
MFMLYLIGITVFSATRSLEHFWSGILDPVGFLYHDAITRYWTVVERKHAAVLLVAARRPASSSTTACSGRRRLLSLACCGSFFPMSVEALTARSQRQARRPGPRAGRPKKRGPSQPGGGQALPRVHQVFGAGTTWRSICRSPACASATSCARFPSGRSSD